MSEATTEARPVKPVRKQFRKSVAIPPSREQMARQMKVAGAAWSELRDKDAVIAFLNTPNEQLGGRPLDVALASDEGLKAVQGLLTGRRSD